MLQYMIRHEQSAWPVPVGSAYRMRPQAVSLRDVSTDMTAMRVPRISHMSTRGDALRFHLLFAISR